MSLNIKKGIKKAIIFFLVLGLIFTVVITIINLAGDKLFPKKTLNIIIDADTGNEIDDLYAISRALIAPELNVVGLTSVHYAFAEHAGDTSVDHSQALNEKLLTLLDRQDIPNYRGAADMLRFFGDPVPNPSPASAFIIRKAYEVEKNKKLNIVALGALTNIASAILIDPGIISRVRIYMMGLRYDPSTKTWNKNEFNARNDLDALDILLNAPNLELHIMTATASSNLVFDKKEAEKYLRGQGGVWDFLLENWDERLASKESSIMWDLALVEAMIDPSLAKIEKTITPPENYQKTVDVYTAVNKELMTASFYAAVIKKQRTTGN